MPTLEEVLDLRRRAFGASMGLVEKKGQDYAGAKSSTGDTLFNIRLSYIVGLVETPAASALVRAGDKFIRLVNLIGKAGATAATDEKVWDTLLDVHNYLDYAYALWVEAELEEKK